jgi:eukaryotic-like serine/threonine-protein kinase
VVPANDFNATLFGVNPTMTGNSDASLRQLTIDQEARNARTQQRPPVAWIWAGIALLLVIVIAVVVWTITLPKDTGIDKGLSVKVPSLKGQSYGDAAASLKKLLLDPIEQEVASSTIAPGAVISTTPAAGSSVSPQSSITVTVSSGPTAAVVPNVSGMSVAAATTALKQVGLVVGTTTQEDSPTVAAGLVVETSPAGGSNATSGEKVNLSTSSGKVNIPSLVGQTGSAAGPALIALHIGYSVIPNAGCTGGKVSAQSLVGEQPQNSSMTITVCTG